MPRIVRFYSHGGPEVLKLDDLSLQEPGPGEVRLKVEAIGLNRAEILFRQGNYLEQPTFPSRIGYEAAGVVEAIGPGVSTVRIGEKVSTIPSFSIGKYGVYGDSAIVPAHAAATYPSNLSPVEAAAIWMQYITAYGALIEFADIKATSIVLITAASSSVGRAAIQIAKLAQATVIATTRSAEKKQSLLKGGADHVIVTEREKLVDRVLDITKSHGVNVVFDPIGGNMLSDLANAAAHSATVYEYGLLSNEPTVVPIFPLLTKALGIRGYTIFEIVTHSERLERCTRYLFEHIGSGALKPVIDRTFPLDKIVEAHRYMESNQQNGKIVITM